MAEQKKRLISLDLLRQLALVLMFASHTTKAYLELNANFDQVSINLIKLALLIEPLSSALFLFVSGYCLVLASRRWAWLKFVKRGVILILASHLLFAYKNQVFSLPLHASGILQLIGMSWLAIPLWKLTRSWISSGITIGLLFIASIFLTQSPPLAIINQGAFPLLPHLIYFAGGVFWARINATWQKNGSILGPKISWVFLLLTLIVLMSITRGRIFSERLSIAGYWQPKPILVVFCLVTGIWLQLTLENHRFFNCQFWSWFTFLSRHSLVTYLTHLIFLQEISPYLNLGIKPLLNLGILFAGCFAVSRIIITISNSLSAGEKAGAVRH